MEPKMRQSSILRMPTGLCLCCGRPHHRYAYAYVVVCSENQQRVNREKRPILAMYTVQECHAK